MASSAAVTASLIELAWEHLPIPALVVDDKRRIVAANPEACSALRLSPEEVQGQDLTEVIRTEDPTWCSTDPVDRLGAPSIGQKLAARIGGARRVLRVGVYPMGNGDGGAGALVTVRDAEAADADADPHEEKDHLTSLGEMSAIVAHEIRNPLTGIRTTVQFVDSKLGEGDAHREDLREVIQEIDRIEQIIEDLLQFARPMEGNRVTTDLNVLLDRALDSMEAQLAEAEIEVKRNLSDEITPFVFSPDNIQQVILNLFRNAMEAMPEGGKLTVTTTRRQYRSSREPVTELFVSDTGHGIPEDLFESIFKPFFTTRHNGTGLGLPISASIVRAHGGRISAWNRAHGGATFRIVLPMETEEKPGGAGEKNGS